MKRYSFLIILFFIVPIINYAQKPDTTKKYDERVIVVGEYKPELPDLAKPVLQPTLEEEKIDKRQLQYSIFPHPIFITYTPSILQPIKLGKEPIDHINSNYAKLGLGNKMAEWHLSIANSIKTKTNYGVAYDGNGFYGKISDYGKPNHWEHNINGYVEWIKNKFTLTLSAGYQAKIIHYYGFRQSEYPDDTLTKKDYLQRYNLMNFDFNAVTNTTNTNDLKQEYNITGTFIPTYLKNSEYRIGASANIYQNVKWLPFKNIIQTPGFFLKYNHYFEDNTLEKYNFGILNTLFSYQLQDKIWSLKLGATIDVIADTIGKVRVFPYLAGKLIFVPEIFELHAKYGSFTDVYSLDSLYHVNPFIHQYIKPNPVIWRQYFSGSLVSTLFDHLHFEIGAIYGKTNEYAYYVNDVVFRPYTRFNVIYDTTTALVPFANVKYYDDKLNINFRIKYNYLETTSEDKPWHEPNIISTFDIKYLFAKKFLVGTDISFIGKRYACQINPDFTTATIELSPFVDWNAHVEYLFNKSLSFYLNVYNLLSKPQYYYWHLPSYKINFIAGVTYNF